MLKDLSLLGFLDEVASSSPAPGGGSSSALAGALACALLEMVCNLTIGKKKYAQYEEQVRQILNKVHPLKEKFISLIDEDASAFNELFHYVKLKELSYEQELARRRAQDRCIEVPKMTMQTALSAVDLAMELSPICNKNAISDLGCALQLLQSAFFGADLNVRINLCALENSEMRAHLAWLEDETKKFKDLYESAFEQVRIELSL